MKKFSKLLAVLLAIVMIVSLLPTMAFAEEETAAAETPAVEETAATIETPAEEAPAETPVETARGGAEAPSDAAAETPADETKEETPAAPAEEAPAEVKAEEPAEPKAEEAPAEKKEEAPIALETAEKKEELVGTSYTAEDICENKSIASGSTRAVWTRTLTADDITHANGGDVVRADNDLGGTTYYTALTTANVSTERAKTTGWIKFTLLTDVELTSAVTIPSASSDDDENKITFDLNSFTLSTPSSGSNAAFISNTVHSGFSLKNGKLAANSSASEAITVGDITGSLSLNGRPTITINMEDLIAPTAKSMLSAYAWRLMINITRCEYYTNASTYTFVFSPPQNAPSDSSDSAAFICSIRAKDSAIGAKGSSPINWGRSNSQSNVPLLNSATSVNCVLALENTMILRQSSSSIFLNRFSSRDPAASYYVSGSVSTSGSSVKDVTIAGTTLASAYARTYTNNYLGFASSASNLAVYRHLNGLLASCDVSDVSTWIANDGADGANIVNSLEYVGYKVDGGFDVTFLDDDGVTELLSQKVANDGNPPAYRAPNKYVGGTLYGFDYWTTAGDATHYSASDLESYTVTADVTFTAHYTVLTAVAVFTPTVGSAMAYTSFKGAFEASEAANGNGIITLLADYTVPDAEAFGDSRTYSMSESLTVDLNGHYLASNRGNMFHFAAANLTLTVYNGAVITGSVNNSGYCISMAGQNNATANVTNVDFYNFNQYTTPGQAASIQCGGTLATKGVFTANNCRFFGNNATNAVVVMGAGSGAAVVKYADVTFTDCTFVSTSSANGVAVSGYKLDNASVINLTFNGTNAYYTKASSAAMYVDAAYLTVDANDCVFLATTGQTYTYTDRYTTAGAEVTTRLAGSSLTGMTKLTQTAAYTVSFYDDSDSLLATQNVAPGGSPTAYTAPSDATVNPIKTFSYWTTAGDATHYTASDLTSYDVNGDMSFTAHYDTTAAVASYTNGSAVTTYYTSLEEAISISCAANTTTDGDPVGKVTLLQDWTYDAYVGYVGSTYVNRISVPIEIDFGGNTYTVPHLSPFMFNDHNGSKKMVVNLYNGTIIAMKENYDPDTVGATYTGYATKCNGAVINFNSGVHNFDFTLTDLNILCLSPNYSKAISINESTEYSPRSTFTMVDCTVVNTSTYPIMQVSGTNCYTDITLEGTTFVAASRGYYAFYADSGSANWTLTLDENCELYTFQNSYGSAAHLSYGTFTTPAGYVLADDGVAGGYSLSTIISDPTTLAELNAHTIYYGEIASPESSTAGARLAQLNHLAFVPSYDITWKVGESTARVDSVVAGETPTPPTAADLGAYEFDTLIGWNTDPSAESGMVIPAAIAPATYYAIVTSNDAPTGTTVASVSIDGGTEHYYNTLTRAMQIAFAHTDVPVTIDLLDDITMSSLTDECGTTASGANFWFSLPTTCDLTLNLNGHTLSGGTDDTIYSGSYAYRDRGVFMAYCNKADSDFNLTIVGGTGSTKGKIKSEGMRQLCSFSNNDNKTACVDCDVTVSNVIFERTAPSSNGLGSTHFFGVNAHSNTNTTDYTFTNCEFTYTGEGTLDGVFGFGNASNIGDYPTTLTMTDCSFNAVKRMATVYRDAVGDMPNTTTTQMTLDAVTAKNVVDDLGGNLTTRVVLSDEVIDGKSTFIVDPMTMVGDVYTPTFKLQQISMSLQDYVYVNVKPNDSWLGAYKIMTSKTAGDPIDGNAGDVSCVTNLAISAKDMDQNIAITIYANPDASTCYLSGTYGSIKTFAALTADAADTSTEKGAALVDAMTAMQSYGDWAKYNFDTTGSVAKPDDVDYEVSGIEELTSTGACDTDHGTAGFYGTSAVLGDQLYLKHYFYKVPALDGITSVTPEIVAAATTAEYGVDKTGKFGTVKLKIMPKFFDTKYTVSVSDGAYTVEGSLASYAAALSTRGTEKEQALAKALLDYCSKAQTYFET